MASNSDSIYYVLTKIKHHPELIVGEKTQYINTISFYIKDSLKIADASFYFPDNQLMVNRLSNDFVAKMVIYWKNLLLKRGNQRKITTMCGQQLLMYRK